MPRPAVSVLLPFRDAASTLDECLDSIAAQTLTNHEVLAVDDGSRDASRARVAARARRDPRVRLLGGPAHRGLVAALNAGLAAARAPVVARMDADDVMHPERLALQRDYLDRHPAVSLVGCRVQALSETPLSDGFRVYLEWQNRCLTSEDMAQEIYVEAPLAHPSVMFRRAAVLALGGYRDGPWPEDYELWLRMVHTGHRLAKLPRTLLAWRDHGARLSRCDPRYARDAFDALRARYLARDPRLRGERPLVFWGAGRRTRRRCRHLHGRGVTPAAWIDIDPRKIGNRLAGVPVHDPRWLASRPGPRPFVLGWVARHHAREEIAAHLQGLGYHRGRDYLMVG